MKFMYATKPKVAEKMAKKQEKKSGKGVFKKLPKKSKNKDEVSLDELCIQDIQDVK